MRPLAPEVSGGRLGPEEPHMGSLGFHQLLGLLRAAHEREVSQAREGDSKRSIGQAAPWLCCDGGEAHVRQEPDEPCGPSLAAAPPPCGAGGAPGGPAEGQAPAGAEDAPESAPESAPEAPPESPPEAAPEAAPSAAVGRLDCEDVKKLHFRLSAAEAAGRMRDFGEDLLFAANSGATAKGPTGLKNNLAHEPPAMQLRDTILEILINCLVIVSSITLFVEVEISGRQLAVEEGWEPYTRTYVEAGAVLEIAEHIMNGVFIFEIMARVCMQQRAFVWDPLTRELQKMNIFDVIVVAITSIDLYTDRFLTGNLSQVRIFRLARLCRILRVFRLSRVFSQLRVLALTVISSFMAFVWSMALLFMFMYAFALFISQSVRLDMRDEALSEATRLFIYRYYGTASRATWTMFEITFSGGWPNYVRLLVEEVHTTYAFPFAFYVGAVVFATTRIITALFLKETMEKASEDVSMVLAEQRKKQEVYMNRLKAFFIAADVSNDGYLSQEEFMAIMEFPEVQSYCSFLELKASDIDQLYHALDAGSGRVSYSEFCTGVLRVKGMARSLDLITVMHDCQVLLKEVQALQDCVGCPRVSRHSSWTQHRTAQKGAPEVRAHMDPHDDALFEI